MDGIVVMEIVVAFYGGDSFIVLQVRSDEMARVINEIRNEVDEYLNTKLVKFYRVNHLSGFADMRIDLIVGVYTRPAHATTTKAFQEQMLAMQERAVKAVEKSVDGGDEWKKS